MTTTESQNEIVDRAGPRMECRPPWLVVRFDRPQRILSWSLTRPGFEQADTVAWLEVRNADLGPETRADDLLRARLAAAGLDQAVPLMTSRDIRCHHRAEARVGAVTATCIATLGLSNGDRVGCPRFRDHPPAGTINMLVHVDVPLADSAMIETVSIATEARTAAILALGWRRHGRLVTGTGTDCIVVACPGMTRPGRTCHSETPAEIFAGLHTDIGEAVGTAGYVAIMTATREWLAEQPAP